MLILEGILEGYGPSVEESGGMRYEYIRIRSDNGKVYNIPNAIALTNVSSELPHAIGNPVKLGYKSYHPNLVYMIEHGDQFFSDVSSIKLAWLYSSATAFGPLLISLILFISGQGIGGIVLLLFGAITLIGGFKAALLFWPSSEAIAAHRRALDAGKIATA